MGMKKHYDESSDWCTAKPKLEIFFIPMADSYNGSILFKNNQKLTQSVEPEQSYDRIDPLYDFIMGLKKKQTVRDSRTQSGRARSWSVAHLERSPLDARQARSVEELLGVVLGHLQPVLRQDFGFALLRDRLHDRQLSALCSSDSLRSENSDDNLVHRPQTILAFFALLGADLDHSERPSFRVRPPPSEYGRPMLREIIGTATVLATCTR